MFEVEYRSGYLSDLKYPLRLRSTIVVINSPKFLKQTGCQRQYPFTVLYLLLFNVFTLLHSFRFKFLLCSFTVVPSLLVN